MGLADDNNNRGQQEQEELRRELDIIYPNALPAVIACTECLSTMQLERREKVRKEKKISFRCPRVLCRTWKSAQEIQKELGIPPVPIRWSDRKRSGVSTVPPGAPVAAAKKEEEAKEEQKKKKKRGERKDKSTSISGDDAQYIIDKILAVRERVDEKTGEKLTEYRVRWENYTRNWDTWEVDSAAFSKKIAEFCALTPDQLAKLQYAENYGTSKKGPKEGHDDKVLMLGALFDNIEKGIRFTVRDADGDLVDDVSPEDAFKANGRKAIGFLMSEMKIGGANKKKKKSGESLPDYAFTEDEEEQLKALIAIANKERNYIEDRTTSESFLCPYEDYQTISELLREMVTEVVHQEMLPLMGFCSNTVSVEKS